MSEWIIVIRMPDGTVAVMETDEEVVIFDHPDAIEHLMEGHILNGQPWEALEINV